VATPTRRQVARALARAGRTDELRRLANAGDPQGCRQLADLLVRAGELDEVRARAAHDRFARRALADWLVGRRRIDEAIGQLRSLAIDADGALTDLGACKRLARLLAGQGRVEEAMAVVAAVPPDRRSNLPVTRWLGSQGRVGALLVRVRRGDRDAGWELERIVLRRWSTLRLREAVELITRVPDPHTYLRYGTLAQAARDYWREGRLPWRTTALEVLGSTEDPFCRLVRADLLLLMGQREAAIVELRGLAARGDGVAQAQLTRLLSRRRPVRELRPIDLGRGAYLCAIAFHPSGILASCAGNDSHVVLWEVHSGERVGTLRALPPVVGGAFSPDGTLFVADGRTRVRVFHAATGQPRLDLALTGFGNRAISVRGVAFGADNTLLAAGALWNPVTGERLRVLDPAAQRAVAITRDGRIAALAGVETESDPSGQVRLWDIRTGEHRHTLAVAASALAFSPDGTRLATATTKGVQLWSVSTGEPLRLLAGPAAAVAFHPNGRLVATAAGILWTDAAVRLWDADTGQVVDDLGTEADAVAFSPDGALLATASRAQGVIQLWPSIKT
jgi:sugar lactone lactonase YvrE